MVGLRHTGMEGSGFSPLFMALCTLHPEAWLGCAGVSRDLPVLPGSCAMAISAMISCSPLDTGPACQTAPLMASLRPSPSPATPNTTPWLLEMLLLLLQHFSTAQLQPACQPCDVTSCYEGLQRCTSGPCILSHPPSCVAAQQLEARLKPLLCASCRSASQVLDFPMSAGEGVVQSQVHCCSSPGLLS